VSYRTFATVSIVFALAAVAVCAIAVILLCVRRRSWAQKALALVLVSLGAAAGSAFAASAESQRALEEQAHQVLALSAAAERAAHARSGRYTTSIASLARLRRGLLPELLDNGATVQARTAAGGSVAHLNSSLGFGVSARLTLRASRRSIRLIARRRARHPLTLRPAA
jgi:hypothetical protein